MNQEMMTTAMIVCTGVTFTSALIAGGFAASAAGAWLRNRREERAARAERQEKRNDRERESWAAAIEDKDREIARLRSELGRLTRLDEIADRLLIESEQRRIGKENDA